MGERVTRAVRGRRRAAAGLSTRDPLGGPPAAASCSEAEPAPARVAARRQPPRAGVRPAVGAVLGRLMCAGWIGLAAATGAAAQTYHSGQNLQPVFEGWEQNADGSFNMVFGYLNRNYEEHLSIPVGPDNRFEPGDPDRGQPTFFYPRRQRIIFRVRVPADWGDRELVWTVTAHGRTDRAVGWLVPEQIIDEQVIAMNRAGGGAPEMVNAVPSIMLVESTERSVRVGEPLTLTAVIRDDGIPAMRPARQSRPPGRRNALGLRLAWIQYRGPGTVAFDPWSAPMEDHTPGWTPPPIPEDGRIVTTARFSEPGTYVIRGMADDGYLYSAADVTVTVTP